MMLSLAQVTASVALSAQAPPPAQAARDIQPPAPEKEESFEEKWLSFSNSALSLKWGWMMMFDGLAMTQDSANEQQVGRVPARGEPRADRFYIGGQIKFQNPGRTSSAPTTTAWMRSREPGFRGWTSPWTSRSLRGWAA